MYTAIFQCELNNIYVFILFLKNFFSAFVRKTLMIMSVLYFVVIMDERASMRRAKIKILWMGVISEIDYIHIYK